MRKNVAKPDRLAGYKEQANRLREFLAKAGNELKHTHALEAVAVMHGFKNYHLLDHATHAREEVWLISTYTEGLMPISHVATNLHDGIAVFCHQLARVATQGNIELLVRAQSKGEYVGLYALNYGALVVSLTKPELPILETRTEIAELEDLSLPEIASSLTDALYVRNGWQKFEEMVLDEGFHELIEKRMEDMALRGASKKIEDLGDDVRAAMATRYLLGISLRKVDFNEETKS